MNAVENFMKLIPTLPEDVLNRISFTIWAELRDRDFERDMLLENQVGVTNEEKETV